jgi:hypothetical protein
VKVYQNKSNDQSNNAEIDIDILIGALSVLTMIAKYNSSILNLSKLKLIYVICLNEDIMTYDNYMLLQITSKFLMSCTSYVQLAYESNGSNIQEIQQIYVLISEKLGYFVANMDDITNKDIDMCTRYLYLHLHM